MDAAETCTAINEVLRNRGWVDAKISHYRLYNEDGGLLSDTAIEVGYVYGECTVRFNRLVGEVDKGTVDSMRGVGPDFVAEVNDRIKQVESIGVFG